MKKMILVLTLITVNSYAYDYTITDKYGRTTGYAKENSKGIELKNKYGRTTGYIQDGKVKDKYGRVESYIKCNKNK